MLTDYAGKELEEIIDYQFKDKILLNQALTHSSFANEQKINRLGNYERLEFLGDAVLELVSSSYFFKNCPLLQEGQLTRKRAAAVCEPALAYCARQIGLGKYILLGKGEEAGGGRARDSILADVMEGLIGAIYLDEGLTAAQTFIDRFILSDLENKQLFYDSKTVLQERVQSGGLGEIHYETMEENGPEHEKQFVVQVWVGEKVMGRGTGKSKKAAEQQAAYEALIVCG